jgi:hypothetical protein
VLTYSYCFTAARTLLLFYQRALELNDQSSAKVLISEIDILRLAFKALANRFAMGARHGGMLQAMLNRITVEYAGRVPVMREDRDVAPVRGIFSHISSFLSGSDIHALAMLSSSVCRSDGALADIQEPNMPAGSFPTSHPDSVLTGGDSSQPPNQLLYIPSLHQTLLLPRLLLQDQE